MSGKWTDRGIECGHEPSHLVADKEGTVVCTKRKGQREEVSVGKMIRAKLFPSGLCRGSEKPVGSTLLRKLNIGGDTSKTLMADEKVRQLEGQLFVANAAIINAENFARRTHRELIARFREVIYEKGLAAPTLEALQDPRFGCPKHPQYRFLWVPDHMNKPELPKVFYRQCIGCAAVSYGAYECSQCGIVLGEYETNKISHDYEGFAAYADTDCLCRLCGTKVGTIPALLVK